MLKFLFLYATVFVIFAACTSFGHLPNELVTKIITNDFEQPASSGFDLKASFQTCHQWQDILVEYIESLNIQSLISTKVQRQLASFRWRWSVDKCKQKRKPVNLTPNKSISVCESVSTALPIQFKMRTFYKNINYVLQDGDTMDLSLDEMDSCIRSLTVQVASMMITFFIVWIVVCHIP